MGQRGRVFDTYRPFQKWQVLHSGSVWPYLNIRQDLRRDKAKQSKVFVQSLSYE
jgi:hypothetical protein